jgi:hypothetical protein
MAAQRQHTKNRKNGSRTLCLSRHSPLLGAACEYFQAADFSKPSMQQLRRAVWTKHRFAAFSSMFLREILRTTGSSMAQSQIELITEQFIENENEPAHLIFELFLSLPWTCPSEHLAFKRAFSAIFLNKNKYII